MITIFGDGALIIRGEATTSDFYNLVIPTFDQTMLIATDEGTIATIDWTSKGKWKIEVPRKGRGFHRLQKANSGGSDVLFIQCAKVWVGALSRVAD